MSNKYKDQYYKLFDFPEIGKKVVYLPDQHSFAYAFHDGVYERLHFVPADIMTVKSVEQSERYNRVYVEENTCTFTPAELVPVECVSEEDIKKIKDFMSNDWNYSHLIKRINKFFRGEA